MAAKSPGELDIHLRRRHIERARTRRPRMATPLKQQRTRGIATRPLSPGSQPVLVKVDTPGAKAPSLRASYVQDGKGRDEQEAPLYGPGARDPQALLREVKQDHHRFMVMVSCPEFPQCPHFDRTAFIAQYMRQVERDLGVPLAWMAANHYDTMHPHTHLVIRGGANGEELYMKRGYFTRGLQAQASRLLTAFVGPVREREQTLEQQQFRAYQAQTQHLNHEPPTAWNSLSHNGL